VQIEVIFDIFVIYLFEMIGDSEALKWWSSFTYLYEEFVALKVAEPGDPS
jgi:hypothetical protein